MKILIYIYIYIYIASVFKIEKKENGEERSRLCTVMWNHLVVSFPLHWNICILCVNLFQLQKIFYLFIIIKKKNGASNSISIDLPLQTSKILQQKRNNNSIWRVLRVIFENPRRKKKAQQQGQQRVGKQMAKPLGPSGKNNRSQAHEINKWALKRQMGFKKPEKREIAYP